MNLACPECNAIYRVDPARVPRTGAATRCRECATTFRVDVVESAPGTLRTAESIDAAGSSMEAGGVGQAIPTEPLPPSGPEEAEGATTTEPVPEAPAGGIGEALGGGPQGGVGGPAPGRVEEPTREPVSEPTDEPPESPGELPAIESPARPPAFGPQDPETRAKRLARALVSDIVVYNQERWERSLASGTLRTEFREEILKSWDEYVEQVGGEVAKRTPFFRDALNAILAEGGRVF